MSKDMKEKEHDMILPIKKKWFDMILSEEKEEEYREIKRYYIARFSKILGEDKVKSIIEGNGDYSRPFKVLFRNGYNQNSPSFVAVVRLRYGYGLPVWGAEEWKKYFVLSILRIEKKEGGK